MRGRLVRPQLITVRQLIPQSGDEFGDASVLLSETRRPSFRVMAQVTWISRSQFEAAIPGRRSDIKAFAQVRRRDLPHANASWDPSTNDLVHVVGVGGQEIGLFVMDVQPAYPIRMSLGRPLGGFDGWRLVLTDREPSASPATQYES